MQVPPDARRRVGSAENGEDWKVPLRSSVVMSEKGHGVPRSSRCMTE